MRISDWSSDVCSSDLFKGDQRFILDDEKSLPGNSCCILIYVPVPRWLPPCRACRIGQGRRLAYFRRIGRRQCDSPCDALRRVIALASRSEERRVGQECVSRWRSRWSTYNYKKNTKT